ncbi:MAG: O-methyltransferase, partial [Calditrichia bacterium]
MEDIFKGNITEYLDSLLPERPQVLQEMEAYAAEKGFPIIGPQVGRILWLLARLQQPARIFELGSGFGYSALWFAMGAPQANIICTDGSAENVKLAEKWLSQAGIWQQIEFRQGRAQEILQQQDGKFDIILNDVDKQQYPGVFELSKKYLATGGLLITDNVIWSGKAADKNVQDEATNAIRDYN